LKLTEHTPEEDMKKAAEERERTIARHTARLPEDKKGVFRMFLKGAQYADLYSEEHDLYCEMQTDALLRLYVLELGRRLVEAGPLTKLMISSACRRMNKKGRVDPGEMALAVLDREA